LLPLFFAEWLALDSRPIRVSKLKPFARHSEVHFHLETYELPLKTFP
jgi:hypothetical protein